MADRTCLDCGVPVERRGKTYPKRCPEHAEAHKVASTRERVRAWQEANPERYAAYQSRYAEANRETAAQRSQEWYQNNTERAIEGQRRRRKENPTYALTDRRRNLVIKYGLSVEDWDALFEAQGRRCPICKASDLDKWDTDHDHATGQVRGILCPPCNRGIGQLKDDPARLRAAAEYLEAAVLIPVRPRKRRRRASAARATDALF